ncbi:IST1-like protein [Actinidia chinensis var. chinensis]|uniref:IST1-like protein n=1 Tax=Actinidia chinensis var. chinensis TaxID=1590841 RepID=A0A2R6QX65_ACTCC|nr:IST1-like protein [Actinidia chinensis var. chinensis]
MFELLFGWRKASKCKKLIRRVQCRIKLLKNKRCSIVRQLRDDVAQLLAHGHEQSAFDRVEQLFKDESIVAVYDLLDHFCEFIIIHLSYIRKHKDCPNDINEAVSTLIFASARCGDLPELPVIRKLFGERYGHRFVTVALELLLGNLVNRQIKENLSIKSVPNDVKYKLVDEIARSCRQQGPLALEYYSDVQVEHVILVRKNKNMGDQVLRNDVQTHCNTKEETQLQDFDIMEAEGKIVHVDFSSDSKNLLIENSPYEFGILDRCTENSSSEGLLSPLPEEVIYLDDIEEFKNPTGKDENYQDQRLFVFKSSVVLAMESFENGFNEKKIDKNVKVGSGSDKNRKACGKRQRKRPVSDEGRSLKDVETTIYGDSSENSRIDKRESHNRRKIGKKVSFNETHECSLEYPCYFCISDDKIDSESQNRKTTYGGFPVHNSKDEKVENNTFCRHRPCFCTRKPDDKKVECEFVLQKPRVDAQIGATMDGDLTYPNRAPNEPMKSDCRPILRATTMPIERSRDSLTDSMLRSNSFPFQQPSHVHPNLPDYDQLAAQFMALKSANLQLLYSKHETSARG